MESQLSWIETHSWCGASLVAQTIKICVQCGMPRFDPWVWKIPWRREWLPIPVFLPGEFHGQRNPWGRKESDRTEPLTLNTAGEAELLRAEKNTHFGIRIWIVIICVLSLWNQEHVTLPTHQHVHQSGSSPELQCPEILLGFHYVVMMG